jgi:hypothetical protein
MTSINLRNEKLEVLPKRYETAFVYVSHVNVAAVYQSNTNVQLSSGSAFTGNWVLQANSSTISQH